MKVIISESTANFFFEVLKWLTPVLLFILAYIINAKIQRNKRAKEKELIKDYLLNQCELLINKIHSQIDQNISCIKRVKNFSEMNLILTKVTGKYIMDINDIPFKDKFEIFVTDKLLKDKSNKKYLQKRHNQFQRSIDFFDEALKALFNSNQAFISNIQTFADNWNKSQRQIFELNNFLISKNSQEGITPSQDPFVAGCSYIIQEFEKKYGKNANNIELGYFELIRPLVEQCKNYSNDTRAAFLMTLLQDARQAYLETKSQRYFQRRGLIETTRLLLSQLRDFQPIIEENNN